jgi:PAS domain S-box-containing protein
MNNSSPLSSFSLRRRPNPGLPSFQALLDQLPHPALILEPNGSSVLLANAGVAGLTAFTPDELSRLNLGDLFPGLDRRQLAQAGRPGTAGTGGARASPAAQSPEDNAGEGNPSPEILASLARRKGAAIEVFLVPTVLDSQKKWLLLAIEPAGERRQRQAMHQRQARLLDVLQTLALSAQEIDRGAALEKALEAGKALTGAGLLAVYGDARTELQLARCAATGPADLLPGEILPADLAALARAQLWTPGKRAVSRFQRAARAARLAYLATVPLGQPHALIGLLAAGSQEGPPEDLLPLLGILSATLTALLQQHSLAGGLRQELQNHIDEIKRSTAITENISDGLVVIAPDLTILEMNPSAEAILGYASREVTGQPYTNILVGAENLIPPFITQSVDSTAHTLGNVRLFRRDGRPFLAHVRTLPVVVERKITSLVILLVDLSQEEQFRLRSQQLEQRALLGEVTAVFAHEVRNPINNISTGLQLMSINLPPEDPNQEIIARLQGDCDRLADLMKSVLAFARPVEYKMEPVDLGASIKRLMERWRPHMARVNVEHSLQIDPEAPLTAGDLRALEQVWNNLISNAIQAMDNTGGSLTLKVRPVAAPDGSRRVEVSVTDTGPGIPEEVRERIFEPFYTTKRTGTGLGLAITKQIITAHKGAISVSSIPGGTVFQVQLPVSETVSHGRVHSPG